VAGKAPRRGRRACPATAVAACGAAGSIAVTSAVGSGSRFVVTLPCLGDRATKRHGEDRVPEARGARRGRNTALSPAGAEPRVSAFLDFGFVAGSDTAAMWAKDRGRIR
jgi:hypothetical protein